MSDSLGARIAALRVRRRLTQQQLADQAGISVDVIRKLEQGQRATARLDTITGLSHALDVPVSELLGKPRGLAPGLAENGEMMALRKAVLGLADPVSGPPSADLLRTRTGELWSLYWAGRYAELARALPGMIDNTRAAALAAPTVSREGAYGALAELLQLAAALLTHLAHEDLAHVALMGAATAAETASDELLYGSQQATRTWLLIRQGLYSEAERLAVTAAEQLEPRLSQATPDRLAVWGELLRYAVTAAARSRGREVETQEMLGLAEAAAAAMQGNRPMRYSGLSFGPTIMAMKRVDVAMADDRPDRALVLAGRVERMAEVPVAIQARYLLNVANAQCSTWESQAAVDTLRRVRDMAPEMIRHQGLARAVTQELLPRRRTQRLPGLTGLASHLGIAV